MSQPKKTRILFVCMGNICRSPTGECVLRQLVADAGLAEQVEIDSAGTIGYHTGNPPDRRMSRAGAKRGYKIVGAARQVTERDFEDFDLVLAMDCDNFGDLASLRGRVQQPRAELRLFCDFCQEHDEQEVPDPYYGGEKGFEKVIDLIEDGCQEIVAKIQRGEVAGG